MDERGRSTLMGQAVVLVGFGNGRHPLDPASYMALSVYQISGGDSFVLCLSQGRGDRDPGLTAEGLDGGSLPGEFIMPFAVRFVGGMKLPTLQKLLEESTLAGDGKRYVWEWKK